MEYDSLDIRERDEEEKYFEDDDDDEDNIAYSDKDSASKQNTEEEIEDYETYVPKES